MEKKVVPMAEPAEPSRLCGDVITVGVPADEWTMFFLFLMWVC